MCSPQLGQDHLQTPNGFRGASPRGVWAAGPWCGWYHPEPLSDSPCSVLCLAARDSDRVPTLLIKGLFCDTLGRLFFLLVNQVVTIPSDTSASSCAAERGVPPWSWIRAVQEGVSPDTWIRSWTWPQQRSHPFSQEQTLLQFTVLQRKSCKQEQTTVCSHVHIWLFIDRHILLYVHMYMSIYILQVCAHAYLSVYISVSLIR